MFEDASSFKYMYVRLEELSIHFNTLNTFINQQFVCI